MGTKHLKVALAGNANVGKSVIFNQLTGLHQHIGNWPGKTVERAEGTLSFGGYIIDIIDLPGIYSLSTFSLEEQISREYIAVERPDVVVNVVDASSLERNLFFTLQLMELGVKMVVALNQMDVAERKGIRIDVERLSKLLGVPVVPTVATKNIGLHQLMARVLEAAEEGEAPSPLRFGDEVEGRIEAISKAVEGLETPYPPRWIAVKLLEGDEEVQRIVYGARPQLRDLVERGRGEIEEIHGHDAPSVIASERYSLASRIAAEASIQVTPKRGLAEWFDMATVHPISGYVFMLTVTFTLFFGIFKVGEWMAVYLEEAFGTLKTVYDALLPGVPASLLWDGVIEGVIAGVTIALPYIVPFYIALSILEDSGYLARIAYLADSAMHRIGLHGKGFIPLLLGFGCNVPACLGCRIMETERERMICAFTATLIPCAARSVVIFGLVARYLGFEWAAALYLMDLALIFILGRIAFKVAPGEPLGLIMEMPPYRWPTFGVTAKKTWFKLRDFIYTAFPIMVSGNLAITLMDRVGFLSAVQDLLTPITVSWLGLPSASGVVLIFGVLRKELALVLLASMLGTTDLSSILTPLQMFVFSFVVMVYIPCIATIAVLVREFGYERAAIISLSEIGLAIFLGGILSRIMSLLGLGWNL